MKTELGIIPAVITPLNEDESIEVESLGRLLDHLLSLDIKGVFMGGTIGEGNALLAAEKERLYRETVRIVRKRVPVLVNVSATGTQRILENTRMAMDADVDGVVMTPRLVFPRRTGGETYRMLEAVSRESSVPVWFYENPEITPVTHDFDQLCQLMELPNIGGLKFSAPNRKLFKRCVEGIPHNLPCYNGVVADMAFAAGVGGGAISGIASMVPELCISIYNAGKSGNMELAEHMQEAINSVYRIYRGKGWPLWPAAQKHILVRRGFFRHSVSTAPFLRLGEEEERYIDGVLESLEPWIFKPETLTLSATDFKADDNQIPECKP